MMEVGRDEEKSMRENAEDMNSVQTDSSALEYTIDCMASTTSDGNSGGFCRDPRHLHAFYSVPFIMLPIYTCSACDERLQPYVTGGNSSHTAVKCMACGVYAHRHCAFSKHIKWKTKCSSATSGDSTDEDDATGNTVVNSSETGEDNSSDRVGDDANTEQCSAGSIQNTTPDRKIPKDLLDTTKHNIPGGPPIKNNSNHSNSSRERALKSIFRGASKKAIETRGFRNTPVINASASVDNVIKNQTILQSVQASKANFPFLSLAGLLPSRIEIAGGKDDHLVIRRSKTWSGVIEESSSSPDSSENTDADYKSEVTPETKPSNSNEISDDQDVDLLDDETTNHETTGDDNIVTAPLHFASHGFRVVSQVFQENIVANFNRLIPTDSSNEPKGIPLISRDTNVPDSENNDSSPSEDNESEKNQKSRSADLEDVESDDEAKSLLETVEPQKEATMDRKRIGLATVAGSIVGGVVGAGLAGPVGGMIGVKCGQTAGLLGLVLEGSVTASVLASGIKAGIAAGQHIQDKHETRVLALGEGTKQRALLMVRPTMQAPEPIWDETYQQAQRNYSHNGSSFVDVILPNRSQKANRERYEREVDIVATGEDELAIADKVILLASRILSNKDSLPGHVYRKLIEAFRRRSHESKLQSLPLQKEEEHVGGASKEEDYVSSDNVKLPGVADDDEKQLSMAHQRRRDAHAVIKYVTTSLLLTRPGFGYSSSLTEKTATAVESLVFGEIYELVMEEIEMEHQERDDLLLEKIANFERKMGQNEDSVETSENSCFGYKVCISEEALDALRCLPQAHSAVDKLRYCVVFLEQISEKFSKSEVKSAMGADSLLKMVCQHILLAKVMGINSQLAFMEEFARDEQLLRGREGYALVTLQASLHFLNASTDFETDIFIDDAE